jgi:hypothetical protein
MFRKDGSKQEVVKFREGKSSFGRFITGRPASLEVDDSCVPILDEIIMTFVYCQKERKDRQKSSSSSSGAATANACASGALGAGASASGGMGC